MLYKNITLAIAAIIVAIASIFVANSYCKWQINDYSYLEEYDETVEIDLSDDVKIENLNNLYYEVGGNYFTKDGWRYSWFDIKSLEKSGTNHVENAELIFSYMGKRVRFNYEIIAISDLMQESVSSGVPLRFQVVAKDKNVSGVLNFELKTHDVLRKEYMLQSLPISFIIFLGFDLLICIVFAIIDYKLDIGLYNLILFLPRRSMKNMPQPIVVDPIVEAEREAKRKEVQKKAEEAKRLARIKEYEAKYDLTKEENAVFKEIAYGTLGKLFINDETVCDDELKLVEHTDTQNG